MARLEPLRDTLQQIDLIHRLVEKYVQHLELAYKAEDIMNIVQKGKVAGILSIEGLHQVGNSASVLRNYYRLGVRCATLTHNSKYADFPHILQRATNLGLVTCMLLLL